MLHSFFALHIALEVHGVHLAGFFVVPVIAQFIIYKSIMMRQVATPIANNNIESESFCFAIGYESDPDIVFQTWLNFLPCNIVLWLRLNQYF